MFFSKELPEDQVVRFVELLRENDGETPVLDVRELPKQVPLPALLDCYPSDSESSSSSTPSPPWPAFVLGGSEDTIVDLRACEECADWLGIPSKDNEKASQLVMVEGLAHDCMLDARWLDAAAALLGWAERV